MALFLATTRTGVLCGSCIRSRDFRSATIEQSVVNRSIAYDIEMRSEPTDTVFSNHRSRISANQHRFSRFEMMMIVQCISVFVPFNRSLKSHKTKAKSFRKNLIGRELSIIFTQSLQKTWKLEQSMSLNHDKRDFGNDL